MNIFTALDQAGRGQAKSREYTDNCILALAEVVLRALDERTDEHWPAQPIDITIPTTGWAPHGVGYSCDIPVDGMTPAILPIVSVDDGSDDAAESCMLNWCCQSMEGVLRVYAGLPPAVPICAQLTIVWQVNNAGATGGVNTP